MFTLQLGPAACTYPVCATAITIKHLRTPYVQTRVLLSTLYRESTRVSQLQWVTKLFSSSCCCVHLLRPKPPQLLLLHLLLPIMSSSTPSTAASSSLWTRVIMMMIIMIGCHIRMVHGAACTGQLDYPGANQYGLTFDTLVWHAARPPPPSLSPESCSSSHAWCHPR